ncbi:glucosyl-3-phosphoglycerate synthase [Saccharopolyspora taberi]|uniref:Glucosyl-3-phosphoglycerate synthase n=1 Tax=Saccharopolyspora taberi TaxID=60895 RepID=A0ABN3VER4_9PSEU
MIVLAEVARWFAERTWQTPAWDPAELAGLKRGRRVSVVLPALNEQRAVAGVVSAVLPFTAPESGPLVDEVVVMDSGSDDDTVRVARQAGARVVRRHEVLADHPPRPGKGEVLWRSLAATSGDLLVFLDADLREFDAGFVPALLGPLLEQDLVLVKGFYERPADGDSGQGGGRVTEILARPLLAALRPQLSGIVQPLGGEYAARRDFLESVPFAPGYGVEIGLLLDAHSTAGLPAIGQVNLGVRRHRHRDLLELGVMSRQVLAAALSRCGGRSPDSDRYCQFRQLAAGWFPDVTDVLLADRPPLRESIVEASR